MQVKRQTPSQCIACIPSRQALTIAVKVAPCTQRRGQQLGQHAGRGEVADGGAAVASCHHGAGAWHQESSHSLGMLAQDVEHLLGIQW